MTRILTVSHFYESHLGGLERVAGHLARALERQGAQVTWAASTQDAAPSDISTLPLPCANPTEALSGLPMPLPGPRALAALWRAVGQAEALVVHDALYVTSIAAMVMAKLRRRRVVLVQHIAAIPFASAAMRALMRLANALVTQPMLSAADEVVFISATVRKDLLGNPPRRTAHLLFNGVDDSIFRPDGPSTRPMPDASRCCLFVGRFVEKKGLSILRALARQRPDLTLLMAGDGPIRPESWNLPNVHVLGPQNAGQLAALYRGADLLLLPSVGEGYPLVIQEAMACGLPVICGAPTHLADPDASRWLHGVAVDLGNVDGSAARCAEAVDGLAISPKDRAAMAAYAGKAYRWDAMGQGVLTLILQKEK
ncbi:glycosyltransferase family 4 protein [Novosphingobium terrae]|uniref:glycosyltransferase family 4 protein n=1 Tax=Novosphingobium terrae TaxID=2726189 RepID=UPI0019806EE0|nr:glycosyltransferase family 4 protein [Novosphingobium terrae]